MVAFGKRPRTLPTVLSVEEVDAHLQCTPNLEHRTYRRRDAYLERCAIILDAIDAPLAGDAIEFSASPDLPKEEMGEAICKRCPSCGGELYLIAATEKPNWHEVLHSHYRPSWCRRFTVSTPNLASTR